jgi:hypothetical protein
MARPPKAQDAIDRDELEKLMRLHPSKTEAADWFGVSESSLERFVKKNFEMSFDALRDKSFVKTKIAIKRAQIEKAIKGDNTMMIWCGKQYLGQSDKMDQAIKHDGIPKSIVSVVVDLPAKDGAKD